jgi:hypothetical protein
MRYRELVEAADNHVITVIARVSAKLSARRTVHTIALLAIPIDDFIVRLTIPFPHDAR